MFFRLLALLIGTVIITSCSIKFNQFKPMRQLNMKQIKINNVDDFSISGTFCASNEYYDIKEDQSTTPIFIGIIKEYSNKKYDYYENVSGFSRLINDQTPKDNYSINNNQFYCSKNEVYFFAYEFTLELNNITNKHSISEIKNIKNQIIEKGYLDIISVKVPFMSITSPIMVSENYSRVYFTDQQKELIYKIN